MLEINESNSNQPTDDEMLAATDGGVKEVGDDEGDDDATTGIHATEMDDDAPQVQADGDANTTEQSADGEAANEGTAAAS